MIIIAGNSHVKLAQAVAEKLSAELIIANTKKFEDQELKVQIDKDLHERDVVILQSTSKPANDHLMELLLLADTAKRAGSRRIIAVMPYFGYNRQDKPSYTYGPISASLVAGLIESTGVDNVITVDLHSRQSEGFFKICMQNLDPLPLFLPLFQDKSDCVVVSPDIGGLARARAFADKLGAELAIINKSRKLSGECFMTEIIGNVTGKNCIIIDDIVDTGGTLCKAAELLKKNGAKSVSACITHGVFSGECIKKIAQTVFDKFYVTDTINHDQLPHYIKIITAEDLIVNALLGISIKCFRERSN
jgi:ribose-phosphate pyrophosphokinase